MKIAVFGLGYVGCVTAACLAREGHSVCGVDISAAKVRMLNSGRATVMEKGLDELVAQFVNRGRLRATMEPAEALKGADVSLVTVGTPSRNDGGVNLNHVISAMKEIGRGLSTARGFHIVALRSTVPPGTTEGVVIPTLERASHKKAGHDFGVCFHPEFLREGSSIHDFFHPPKTVIGVADSRSARRLIGLWKGIKAPLLVTPFKVAEIVKYADNAFHALKVCFANEIGALCKHFEIDGQQVMDIFVQDTKLNISPLYLKPGFAFGGPCLPKDVRALGSMARKKGLHLPLTESILPSNARHLERALELVLETGRKNIGVLGLTFKSDTDDLRESPSCALVKKLLLSGKKVRIYDPRVQLERLLGANRSFIKEQLPSLSRLMVSSLKELLESSDVIVLLGYQPEFASAAKMLKKRKIVIDMVRPKFVSGLVRGRYHGIAW